MLQRSCCFKMTNFCYTTLQMPSQYIVNYFIASLYIYLSAHDGRGVLLSSFGRNKHLCYFEALWALNLAGFKGNALLKRKDRNVNMKITCGQDRLTNRLKGRSLDPATGYLFIMQTSHFLRAKMIQPQ